MLSTSITKQARQQEWNTVCTIARNNGFPLQTIHNLRSKIIRTQKTKNTPIQKQRMKWITFTYHSPLIHKVTNLFKVPTLTQHLEHVTPYTINYATDHQKMK